MLFLKEVLSDSFSTIKPIRNLPNCILENMLASLFKDVLNACIIFIPLPVAITLVEVHFQS